MLVLLSFEIISEGFLSLLNSFLLSTGLADENLPFLLLEDYVDLNVSWKLDLILETLHKIRDRNPKEFVWHCSAEYLIIS